MSLMICVEGGNQVSSGYKESKSKDRVLQKNDVNILAQPHMHVIVRQSRSPKGNRLCLIVFVFDDLLQSAKEFR